MSRCVILSAGPVRDPEALKGLLRPDDWIIAADNGWNLARRLGVMPRVLVADFDSMPQIPSRQEGLEILRLPVEKDWTDTMAAAMEGVGRGYREFLLLGATGGRLDHTMANFSVLLYLLEQGAEAVMADEQNRVRLYRPGAYTLEPEEGYKFSLFPFGGEVTGLYETDVYYPLEDTVLRPDSSLGISNEFIRDPEKNTLLKPKISFKTGNLMIFLSKD